jgi:hypothetical protein
MTCAAVNKGDDHFCGGCGANLPGISVAPVEVAPIVPPIPSIPRKRPPPPAPTPALHKRTVAIETVSDLVISEMPIEMPIG